jgi:hypothetical protein
MVVSPEKLRSKDMIIAYVCSMLLGVPYTETHVRVMGPTGVGKSNVGPSSISKNNIHLGPVHRRLDRTNRREDRTSP